MFKLILPEVDKNIKITGKSVFALYLAYKNHMEGRYDAVKYKFNINVTNAAYDKRKDKFYFEKFSKNIHLFNWLFYSCQITSIKILG